MTPSSEASSFSLDIDYGKRKKTEKIIQRDRVDRTPTRTLYEAGQIIDQVYKRIAYESIIGTARAAERPSSRR